jgi:hypothetical protein
LGSFAANSSGHPVAENRFNCWRPPKKRFGKASVFTPELKISDWAKKMFLLI